MTFSDEWDKTYSQKQNMSTWPWSDLVSYVSRYVSLKQNLRVLELGFGVGANIPFFIENEFDYHGIEGSQAGVDFVLSNFPDLSHKIIRGDFTSSIPFDGGFDLIVDRSSLTHNSVKDIIRSLTICKSKLSPKGKFIGLDWFSNAHGDSLLPSEKIDDYTRCNFTSGQFKDIGAVHFADENHLLDLFEKSGLHLDLLVHKEHVNILPKRAKGFAAWNLVASKRI